MRVKKLGKIIAIMVVIILLIEVTCTTSLAGFLDGVRGESGSAPPPSTPSDSPSYSPPSSSSSTTASKDENVYYYRWLSGQVTEIVNNKAGTQGEDDVNEEVPVEGVLVKLGDMTVRTGADGTYKFDNVTPGTYDLQFDYGNIEGIDSSDISKMKNALKYNGHDYIAASTPKGGTYIDSQTWEITQSGKGALQFFIALDCSSSMRRDDEESLIHYNGKDRTRLDIAVEAAKALCANLLNSGGNIYIGLVFFSGTNYRAVSLTKDLALLNEALDDINTNGWYTANTNIVGALDKVYQSFANNTEESNRYVAIISDGVPTSDGTTETYWNDSDQAIYNKLETISKTTIGKLDELIGNGVKVISLITKTNDEQEDGYVDEIFNGDHSTVFEHIEDGYNTANIIENALGEYLKQHTEEKYYESTSEVFAGYEDEERREDVDSYFDKTLNYDNTNMFDQILNYSPENYDKAKTLSDMTSMKVYGGTYSFDPDPTIDKEPIYEEDPETGDLVQVGWRYHVRTGYDGVNMALEQRPEFSLATEITATGLRVILQNGQQIDTQIVDAGTNLPIIQTLDSELAQGTTLQIEYTVKVSNKSSMQCNELELINYLPEEFSYDPNIRLISEDGINADVGWEEVSLEDLQSSNLLTEETVKEFEGRQALRVSKANNGEGEYGFFIPSGGSYEFRYVISRLIGGINDMDNPDFSLASEVLSYRNAGNRRMAYIQGEMSHQLVGAYPGDSKDQDFTDESTNYVIVLPPTGKEEDVTTLPKILSSSVLGLILEKIN